MTEQYRKIIIDRIEKNLEIQLLKENAEKRKEELKQNEMVKEYLEIEKKIKQLNSKIKLSKNKEQTIYLEFVLALSGAKKNADFSCEHDIWIYCGSFEVIDNKKEYRLYDEESDSFAYNKYMCLECRKFILVGNWKKFEKENFVLKNREDINSLKYLSLYYQLLFEHTVNEARDIVISEFNQNLIESKKKIKQK